MKPRSHVSNKILSESGKDTESPLFFDKIHAIFNGILNNVKDEKWISELFDATKDAMSTYATHESLKVLDEFD